MSQYKFSCTVSLWNSVTIKLPSPLFKTVHCSPSVLRYNCCSFFWLSRVWWSYWNQSLFWAIIEIQAVLFMITRQPQMKKKHHSNNNFIYLLYKNNSQKYKSEKFLRNIYFVGLRVVFPCIITVKYKTIKSVPKVINIIRIQAF